MTRLPLILPLLLLPLAGCDTPPWQNTNFAEATEKVSLSGTITAVDLPSRRFVVRGDRGTTVQFRASDEVRNLAQLEVGDQVELEYYESVAVGLADPNDGGEVLGDSAVIRAPEGERPGAAAASIMTLVVEFQSYDPESFTATFVTPDGDTQTAFVPKDLRAFAAARAPGDRVAVSIDRAIAVVVNEVAG